MQTFRPEKAPRDPKELADWLDRTMLQAQRAANTGSDSLPLRVLHVAPTRPQDGWLYNADGTNWDPLGDGSAGIVRYDASVPGFVRVGGVSGLITASDLTMNTDRLLGRTTAAAGAIEEIEVSTGLDLTDGVLTATGSSTGGHTLAIGPLDCSDETTALTTGLKKTFRMPYAMTLTEVPGGLTTAATGVTLCAFDLQEEGVSVFTTKPTFDAGEKTTVTATTPQVIGLLGSYLPKDAEMTVICDAIGSTIAGAGLKISLVGTVGAPLPDIDLTGLAAWYRYGIGITDVAGAVSQWDDQSGNARHLLQATAGAKPTKQSDGSILFDGTSDYLEAAFSLAQPTTIYLLLKTISWTPGNRYICDGNTLQSRAVIHNGATTIQSFVNGGGGSCDVSFAASTYGVITAVFDGATSALQVDNNTEDTGALGTGSGTGFTLGREGGGGFSVFTNIQVKEILIYSAAHDTDQRDAVKAYLATV
jgi:hypothetical protein